MLKHLSKRLFTLSIIALFISAPLAFSASYSPFRDIVDIIDITGCETLELCEQLYEKPFTIFLKYDLPVIFGFIFFCLLVLYFLSKGANQLFNILRAIWKDKSSH